MILIISSNKDESLELKRYALMQKLEYFDNFYGAFSGENKQLTPTQTKAQLTFWGVPLVPYPGVVSHPTRRPPLLLSEFLSDDGHPSANLALHEFEFFFGFHGNETGP